MKIKTFLALMLIGIPAALMTAGAVGLLGMLVVTIRGTDDPLGAGIVFFVGAWAGGFIAFAAGLLWRGCLRTARKGWGPKEALVDLADTWHGFVGDAFGPY